jgi:hypothetical protein
MKDEQAVRLSFFIPHPSSFGFRMPDPQRLLATLRKATAAFRTTPGRTGRFTRLPEGVEVLVVGDMHGSVENMRLVLEKAQLAANPRRHLVVQEVIHGPFAYTDSAGGGDKSHQLLDVVAALKCQFPERVHYLLGNHELAQWRHQAIGKGDIEQNGWFDLGVRTAYGSAADEILRAYEELFAVADLALRTANRVFLCHTVPPMKVDFSLAKLEAESLDEAEYHLGGAIHGILWGRDVRPATVHAFLAKVDADWLISGHIPCPEGFSTPNDRQIILDALGYPACYCLFPTDVPMTQEALLERIGTL